jgi:type III restriction enzyme
MGYRYELQEERINANFSADSQMAITTADIPTETEVSSMVGETRFDNLYGMKSIRLQSVDFELAKKVLETYFKDDEGGEKPWLFPQLIRICKDWREKYLTCKDNTFPQLVLLTEKKDMAAKKIYLAIVAEKHDEKTLKPILRPYDTIGSTRYVEFDTTRSTYPTRPDKCHISHVVCDTESWEQKMAQALEEMDEVNCYVKNQGLGFAIPYTMDGEEREYIPDFIVKMKPNKEKEALNLIVEVSGEQKRDKPVKTQTAKTLWVPAINNHGGFGKWAFIEISDPWDAKNTLRSYYGR